MKDSEYLDWSSESDIRKFLKLASHTKYTYDIPADDLWSIESEIILWAIDRSHTHKVKIELAIKRLQDRCLTYLTGYRVNLPYLNSYVKKVMSNPVPINVHRSATQLTTTNSSLPALDDFVEALASQSSQNMRHINSLFSRMANDIPEDLKELFEQAKVKVAELRRDRHNEYRRKS